MYPLVTNKINIIEHFMLGRLSTSDPHLKGLKETLHAKMSTPDLQQSYSKCGGYRRFPDSKSVYILHCFLNGKNM